jgi:hypothetical protein
MSIAPLAHTSYKVSFRFDPRRLTEGVLSTNPTLCPVRSSSFPREDQRRLFSAGSSISAAGMVRWARQVDELHQITVPSLPIVIPDSLRGKVRITLLMAPVRRPSRARRCLRRTERPLRRRNPGGTPRSAALPGRAHLSQSRRPQPAPQWSHCTIRTGDGSPCRPTTNRRGQHARLGDLPTKVSGARSTIRHR